MIDAKKYLPQLIQLAKQAGSATLVFRQPQFELDIQIKKDTSPVTAADMAAHNVIMVGLKQLTPDIPVLSEESAQVDFKVRQAWDRYWLVDPLDGTKGFIEGSANYTVNIALINSGISVLGVIYAPVLDCSYYAIKGEGAFKQCAERSAQKTATRRGNSQPTKLLGSAHHGSQRLKKWLKVFGCCEIQNLSSSIKFCLIAEGKADLSVRLGPTSEWDTAAGQCIVEAAGGEVLDLKGQPLRYNQQDSLINPDFIVVSNTDLRDRVLATLT